MDELLAIPGAFLSWGKASGELFAAYALVLFFKISAVVFLAFRVFLWLRTRSESEAGRLYAGSLTAPAEIAELVAKLARQNLEIGAEQLDEPMEKLRIPRGDFLRFLDDLEVDYGLSVPASARSMSASISGITEALCQRG